MFQQVREYEEARAIIENVFNKKEELKVTADTSKSADELKDFIVEQLTLSTRTESKLVKAIFESYKLGVDFLFEFICNQGHELNTEAGEVIITYKHAALKVLVYEHFIKCLKALKFSGMFKLTDEDWTHLQVHPVNLLDLPCKVADSNVSFEAINNLMAICRAGKYLKKDQNRFAFYKLIQSSGKTQVNSELSTYIDWAPLLAAWQHNDTFLPNGNYNPCLTWFVQMGEIQQHMDKYGVDYNEALKWIDCEGVQSGAQQGDVLTQKTNTIIDLAAFAKTKIGIETYQSIIGAERNKLRSKQRDALVQYILEREGKHANPVFTDVNDLFSYFLIDTQMAPVVSSSRILQATLAVQSFIQRVQMNLEPGIYLTKKDAKKWDWMGLYRVWEANRKIFLYPENWIEPELRDDKTPFFKELEKELTGKEVSGETVESSFMDYVSKLEKVANIEICQMYNEEINSYTVLHVIGRSRFEPKEYFYRKLVNESYWTPWEKMGIEINSDHVAPAVINDRLVTFWLECTEAAEEPSNDELSVDPGSEDEITMKKAQKQLQLQLCWSELIDNKWTAKRSCEEVELVNLIEPNEDCNCPAHMDKQDIRLVYDAGRRKLHLLYEPQDHVEHNDYREDGAMGATFIVDCFNHVHVKRTSGFAGWDYIMPRGMRTNSQKAETVIPRGRISLPVAGVNGVAYLNQVVNSRSASARVIYPHQYENFICNAPFVVEADMQSLVFIPKKKADRSSMLLKRVVDKTSTFEQVSTTRSSHTSRSRSTTARSNSTSGRRSSTTRSNSTSRRRSTGTVSRNSIKNVCIHRRNNSRRSKSFKVINTMPPLTRVPVFKPTIDASLGYHPYMEALRANLQKYGIDGILDPTGVDLSVNNGEHKLLPKQANKNVLKDFSLNDDVVNNLLKEHQTDWSPRYIEEQFEFGLSGAYSLYNWELFFHIPFLIANRFYVEGNYKESLKWMHYIFDPRETDGQQPSKFWKFKPFADNNASEGIDDLLYDLNMNSDSDPKNKEFEKQLEVWGNDPFKPHNIARMRITAYMKAVVMRYLDVVMAHGDDLFRTDTRESINEAMQYYVIATQLLGRKPEVIQTEIEQARKYTDFGDGKMGNCIENFENSLIKPENVIYLEKFVESNELEISSKPYSREKDLKGLVTSVYGAIDRSNTVGKLYFGIPKNDKLLNYWNRVADRLFKIRNSLNIDGEFRSQAFFAPPIDPALLIRAQQAGIDIGKLVRLNDANQTEYRFQTLLQRALEISQEVKSLGSQLLSALEKGDNESIARLKAGHEVTLSEMVTAIKEKSIKETEENLEQLRLQKESIKYRENYYRKKKKISRKELQQLKYMDAGLALQTAAQALQLSAGTTNLFPNLTFGASGFGGSPHWVIEAGGEKAAATVNFMSSALNMLGSIANNAGNRAGILAGYDRRKEEWNFQADMARQELKQLNKQEIAAEIRKEIAGLDLKNHKVQVKQSHESYEVLSSKFTNDELYLWMATEISRLYGDVFNMAYQMAKQAEAAYNFELHPDGLNKKLFITNEHFQAQRKGLLAGEKLYMQLKQMESEYLADHKRKYELTKHVSLAMLDPQRLLDLRKDGECKISIPEVLFDLDHPGHCNRRIKSVSLTIPCVTGAYTSVSANLTLGTNSITLPKNDTETKNIPLYAKVNKMATSTAVNDSGLFELSFNDARYLPFEGAGVASNWTLSLPNQVRQFDYNSISDVILHINYTAEDGLKREDVETATAGKLNDLVEDKQLVSMFSLKAQYPEAWAKVTQQDVTIEITKSQLPYYLQGRTIQLVETLPQSTKGVVKGYVIPGDLQKLPVDSQTGQATLPVISAEANAQTVNDVISVTVKKLDVSNPAIVPTGTEATDVMLMMRYKVS